MFRKFTGVLVIKAVRSCQAWIATEVHYIGTISGNIPRHHMGAPRHWKLNFQLPVTFFRKSTDPTCFLFTFLFLLLYTCMLLYVKVCYYVFVISITFCYMVYMYGLCLGFCFLYVFCLCLVIMSLITCVVFC